MPKDGTILAGAMPVYLIAKDIAIVGSAVGTKKDTDEALEFTARGLVHPILTHGTLYDLNDFVARMAEGKLPGRAVLKVAA
jgi:propanol-preferring alcohol dehydrogenase